MKIFKKISVALLILFSAFTISSHFSVSVLAQAYGEGSYGENTYTCQGEGCDDDSGGGSNGGGGSSGGGNNNGGGTSGGDQSTSSDDGDSAGTPDTGGFIDRTITQAQEAYQKAGAPWWQYLLFLLGVGTFIWFILGRRRHKNDENQAN